MYRLRVVLVDPDTALRKHIRGKLMNAGHHVIGEASDSKQAVQAIFNLQPDLVIISAQLPGRDGLDVAKTIVEHKVAPVIVVAEPQHQDEVTVALPDWAISYILKPIEYTNLIPAIEVSVSMYRKLCRLEDENRKLKQSLATRKVVEQAKGLLIEFKGMTEQQAFKHLQKISMNKCQPIQNVAKSVIKSLGETKESK